MKNRTAAVLMFSLGSIVLAPACAAQSYPLKPIRVIVAQAPGSASDVLTRVITTRLQESLHQPIVVDTRPGAGGSVGTAAAAKAAPDGYTLLAATNATHGSNPALYAKLPYDAVKSFAPIIFIATTPFVLVVHPSLPVKNVGELIALAKSYPGKVNYASPGNASANHLSAEFFKKMASVDMVHVAYKGTTPAIAALLTGEVSMMFSTVTAIQPHMKRRKVRVLGVTTLDRTIFMPNVPTVAEDALPGFEMRAWLGFVAPAGTQAAIVNHLNAEVSKLLALTEVKSALATQGFEIIGGAPDQFAEHIQREISKMTYIAKAAGVKAD